MRVWWRFTQRLEQPGRHQDRHIMRPAVQHPGGLFGRQPGGQPAAGKPSK
jgi:hypothetical protein